MCGVLFLKQSRNPFLRCVILRAKADGRGREMLCTGRTDALLLQC